MKSLARGRSVLGIALAACALVMGLVAVEVRRAPPSLELTLSVERATVPLGQRPKFHASLKNTAITSAVYALGCLDGSAWGDRYPRWDATATVNGVPVEKKKTGYCGNTNPLRVSDFVVLKPGESFDPFAQPFHSHDAFDFTFKLDKPGTYEFQLTYDTSPENDSEFFGYGGGVGGDAIELLRKLPRGTVRSNVVEVTIR